MADILNPTVWFEIDDNNVSGTQPSFPENMAAKQLNNAARAVMGAVKRMADQHNATRSSTGTATNFALTYTVVPDGLYSGQLFRWIPHLDSAANPNLNVNGLGNYSIKKVTAGVVVDLVAGDIQAGFPVEVIFVPTSNIWLFMNPPLSVANASDTVYGTVKLATPAQLLESAAGSDNLVVTVKDASALWEIGTAVAGATSIVLGVGGLFHITGTGWTATSITFSDPSSAGRSIRLIFDAAGGILKDGALLSLPGNKDITVKAGDVAMFTEDTGNVMTLVSYQTTIGAAYTDYDLGVIAVNGVKAQAHGLGALPGAVTTFLKCTTANIGYAVGDYLPITDGGRRDTNSGLNEGLTTFMNATTVGCAASSEIALIPKAGGVPAAITLANWSIVMRVFK